MSDDLISRKSLIENLNKFAPKHYTALVNDLIMKEQTAFDKEKAIEEIKGIMDDESIRFVDQAIRYAIEIVKKGGIE